MKKGQKWGFETCHFDIPQNMTRKPSYTLPLFGPSMTESLKCVLLGHLFDNLEGGKHAFWRYLVHIGVYAHMYVGVQKEVILRSINKVKIGIGIISSCWATEISRRACADEWATLWDLFGRRFLCTLLDSYLPKQNVKSIPLVSFDTSTRFLQIGGFEIYERNCYLSLL